MKRLLSMILACTLTTTMLITGAKATDARTFGDFEDIDPQYVEAVTYVTEQGILSGYNDNTFKPQYILTRGAAAKIISAIELGVETSSALVADVKPYPDVPLDHVFSGYIAYCAYLQYVNGYSDGSFRPSDTLTGYAFAKMLLKATSSDATAKSYTGSAWKADVFADAIKCGLFSVDMAFDPNGEVSREAAAWLIYNAIKDRPEYNPSVAKPEYGKDIDSSDEQPSSPNEITTSQELEEYLNERYANGIDLPIGHQTVKFEITHNDRKNYLFDYNIKASGSACIAVDVAEGSISYSEDDISRSREILKNIQLDVFNIASEAFPSAKLCGGYESRGYRYEHIRVDLHGWAWDSWTNYYDMNEHYVKGFGVSLPSSQLTYYDTYVTEFHWCPNADGYFD